MLRSTRCKHCKAKFEEGHRGPLHAACIDAWIAGQIAKKKAKQAREQRARAKVERAVDRKKREAMKPRRKWLAECQVVVNKCARLRDLLAGRGCISCGAKPEQCFGGAVDAGHYRSVGSAPHLRFFLPQIRLQCVQCNRHLSGNAVEFRRGLVELMGLAWVERIEAMQGTAKWSIEYLKRLKAVMTRLARRLEKRLEQR